METDLAAVAAAEMKRDEEEHDEGMMMMSGDGGGEGKHRRRRRPGARWIVKRAVGGEGKGITVVTDASAALECVRNDANARMIPTSLESSSCTPASSSAAMPAFPSGSAKKKFGIASSGITAASHVVQRLVPRPLLVNGFKVDIRAYVLVTSWGSGAGEGRGIGDDGRCEGGDASGDVNGEDGGCGRRGAAAGGSDDKDGTTARTNTTGGRKHFPPRAYLYDEAGYGARVNSVHP